MGYTPAARFREELALNSSLRDADMIIVSPVLGLRALRSGITFV